MLIVTGLLNSFSSSSPALVSWIATSASLAGDICAAFSCFSNSANRTNLLRFGENLTPSTPMKTPILSGVIGSL